MNADAVMKRLEDAGRTLLSMPPASLPGRMRPVTYDQLAGGVREFQDALGRPLRCTPSPQDIDLMDEALEWLPLIPQDRYVIRRIVACRALVSPLTDRHLFPWRRIGTLIGADHKAVQRWHGQGIDYIVTALKAQRQGRAA